MPHRHPFMSLSPSPIWLLIASTLAAPLICLGQESILPSVEVTAGRLQVKQFDTPASTYLVDQNYIANTGNQVNLSDALSLSPGVVSLNRNNYAQDVQISIRGFGARTAFGLRGIRLIADDIPLTTPDGQGQASSISLPSVGQLEVLSGPLAQLYGNSSGGVIQTHTREATATPQGSVQTFVGSFGTVRTDWQASERISQVGIVADVSSFKTSGWRQNSAAEREQLNSVITYDPQADTRVKLVLNALKMPNAQDPLGLNLNQLKANPQLAGTNALLDQTQKSIVQNQMGLVLQQTLNADLKFQGRVYFGNRGNTQTQASSSVTAPQTGSFVGLQRSYDGMGLQLTGREVNALLPWSWTVGFDWDSASENRQSGSTNYGLMAPAPTTIQNVASNNDLFAQANVSINERWTLTAGARHDQVKIINTNLITPAAGGSSTFSATTPVIGVTWHVQDDLNIYSNAGLGFETPTTAETAYSLVGPSVTSNFNAGLQAAQSHHYELGTKWMPSPAQSINAAAFYITTTNDIIATTNSSGKSVYQNVGQTTRQGFELSIKDVSDAHFKEQAALTLVKAQYNSNFNSSAGTIASGNSMPAIPNQTLYTSLSWSQNPYSAKNKQSLVGAEVELDLSARSAMWANDANTSSLSNYAYAPGYATFDLKLHERFLLGNSNLEGYLSVNNLTNKSYVGSVIVNSSSAGYFEPGLPRNWVLGMKLNTPLTQ